MVKGLASATHEAFANPGLVLLILVVTVLSAGFHEFGHAAAARRGGATPGVMGTGLYLIWPAFYTDVTDSYRLGRGGRIRTDLGGLYFNAIVAVAIMGIWWATGFDALLLVVVTQILQMVRQLLPLVRFDGYHILADVTGVPDLFQRIKPTLLGLLPWRRTDPEAQAPQAVGARRGHRLGAGHRSAAALQPGHSWCCPCRGSSAPPGTAAQKQYAMLPTAPRRRGHRRRRRAGAGDRRRRAARAGHLATSCSAWSARSSPALWQKTRGKALQRGDGPRRDRGRGGRASPGPGGPAPTRYRPIQPYERGTLADATTAVFPAGAAHRHGARARRDGPLRCWPDGAERPTREEPQLSMVLVPRDSRRRPGRPAAAAPAPRPGSSPSTSRPLRRRTTTSRSRSTPRTVPWSTTSPSRWSGPTTARPSTTRNEAYAFASCADCAAVAVGFQVVLIVGQTDVIVPENLSAAANYNCVQCLTYALASQLVLTLDGPAERRRHGQAQRAVAADRGVRAEPAEPCRSRRSRGGWTRSRTRSWRSSRATPAPRRAVPPARPPPRQGSPSPGASADGDPRSHPGRHGHGVAPQPGATAAGCHRPRLATSPAHGSPRHRSPRDPPARPPHRLR